MRKLSYVLFCTCTLLVYSCQNYEDFREVDRVDHNPELAIPLVNSSLSLDDILENEEDFSFLTIAPDGSMSYNYSQDPVEKAASELIEEMEDFPLALVDSFMSVPVQLFENFTVSKLNLKNGTIAFDIQSSHTEDINLKITFPGMTQNGSPFEMQSIIEYQGTTPTTTSISPTSIQNFALNLAGGNLDIRYEAYNNAGQRVLLDLITGEAKDWTYSSIEGIWANETFTVNSDTIEVDLFDDITDGEISFADPKLILDIQNSIGFPVQMKIENMMAYTVDGNSIPFTSIFSDGYNLKYPGLNEMGQETSDQIVLDKNNSNIISILNARPKYIVYDVVGIINPEDAQTTGFIAEDSKVKGEFSIEIPIYGTASDFTIESISDFELEDIEQISHAEFKLITDNGIPLDLEMQVYFMDENGLEIDSLLQGQTALLSAPEMGANGAVINTTEQTNIIEIPAERVNLIQTAKQIKVKASLSTANQGMTPVRILSTQELKVRLGAILGIDN